MEQYQFNLTSFIVLCSILIFGVALIQFYSVREKKREKKILERKFPSATRKYSKEVNDKLDIIDIRNYHKY